MNDDVARSTVEDFYRAYDTREAGRIAAFLDDDIEWDVFGPAAVMQVCGQWRGKEAVIDRFARVVPGVIEFKRFDRECLIVDSPWASVNGRITSRHRQSGRIISHRVAHFLRFRCGKLVAFRAINDTLDAAEQFIGHRIDLGVMPAGGDLVGV